MSSPGFASSLFISKISTLSISIKLDLLAFENQLRYPQSSHAFLSEPWISTSQRASARQLMASLPVLLNRIIPNRALSSFCRILPWTCSLFPGPFGYVKIVAGPVKPSAELQTAWTNCVGLKVVVGPSSRGFKCNSGSSFFPRRNSIVLSTRELAKRFTLAINRPSVVEVTRDTAMAKIAKMMALANALRMNARFFNLASFPECYR